MHLQKLEFNNKIKTLQKDTQGLFTTGNTLILKKKKKKKKKRQSSIWEIKKFQTTRHEDPAASIKFCARRLLHRMDVEM